MPNELSHTGRQELQNKLTKLLSILAEVSLIDYEFMIYFVSYLCDDWNVEVHAYILFVDIVLFFLNLLQNGNRFLNSREQFDYVNLIDVYLSLSLSYIYFLCKNKHSRRNMACMIAIICSFATINKGKLLVIKVIVACLLGSYHIIKMLCLNVLLISAEVVDGFVIVYAIVYSFNSCYNGSF